MQSKKQSTKQSEDNYMEETNTKPITVQVRVQGQDNEAEEDTTENARNMQQMMLDAEEAGYHRVEEEVEEVC